MSSDPGFSFSPLLAVTESADSTRQLNQRAVGKITTSSASHSTQARQLDNLINRATNRRQQTTMYPRPKRVAPFSTPRLHHPLPILASHLSFCERAASATLLTHEVAGSAPNSEGISHAALLSVVSTTSSRDDILNTYEASGHSVPEFLNAEARSVTPDSISVAKTSWSRNISWPTQPELIAKPPGEPGRPGTGGYNVNDAMKWPRKKYDALQVGILLIHHSYSEISSLCRSRL